MKYLTIAVPDPTGGAAAGRVYTVLQVQLALLVESAMRADNCRIDLGFTLRRRIYLQALLSIFIRNTMYRTAIREAQEY